MAAGPPSAPLWDPPRAGGDPSPAGGRVAAFRAPLQRHEQGCAVRWPPMVTSAVADPVELGVDPARVKALLERAAREVDNGVLPSCQLALEIGRASWRE